MVVLPLPVLTQASIDRIDDVLARSQQLHGTAVTSADTLFELEDALSLSLQSNDVVRSASIYLALANHYMIDGQITIASQQCDSGLALVRGTHTDLEVRLLVMKARRHYANDVRTSRELTTEAMTLSASIHGRAKASVLLRHGEAVGADGDIDQAIALLRQAEATYELDGDTTGRLHALLRLCVQLVHRQHFALVVEYASEAIALAEELHRTIARLNGFKFLAMALTAVGRLGEAYEVGRHALDIAEAQYPGNFLIADCTGVLGDVYLKLNDLPTSLRYFARALSIYRDTGYRNGQALCLLRIGEVYALAGQTEQAERLFVEADELARRIGNNVLHRSIAISSAGLYTNAGDDARAASIMKEIDERIPLIEVTKPTKGVVDRAIETFRSIAAVNTTQTLPSLEQIDITLASSPPSIIPALRVQRATSTSILVETLGVFRVTRKGEEITMEEWRRKKARDVFKYLVSRHRPSVTVDDIVAQLWGEDVDVERCLPTLQNAISAIRTALEPGLKPRQNSAYLQFRDGSYYLDLGVDAIVDVHQFATDAKRALAIGEQRERLDALTHAAHSYTGDFLPHDTFEDWTDFIRGNTRDLALEVLDQLAALQFDLGLDAAARITMQRSVELEG